ncbi:sulfotransferase family protein [Saccharobesus litoralis]|uniref:Sulfotransferase family protein n=1 Tax=Saccharobesus litoralis TaxID=2172099 RepID=A0A2S0VSH3_9ALTE|nr:sulfotransferase [Saccharobesus litoralis]AWB67171.1 sulfotransferase family protein [Saccharobesus litoralis]
MLSRQFHFISGLPRSGSTLLAAILRQNPRMHASISSPVLPIIHSCLEQVGAGGEFYTFFDQPKRQHLCQSIFNSYYVDQEDKSIVFDTNRLWTARLHQLVELFDDFKVICCVRNPAWVADSFEVIYRKNPFDYSRMYTPQTRQTVYSRCEAIMAGAGAFGSAWSALKEAFYGEFSEKLLLVDYDLMTQHPAKSLELIYQFLGVDLYTHDFNNVEYEEGEFDSQLGVKGLHTVASKVEFKPRRSVLPPDLFKKYSDMAFWLDPAGSAASILAPKNN